MKSRHYIIFALIVLVFSLGSYQFGAKAFREAAAVGLKETQAMLAFNHFRRYQEIQNCLNGEKIEEAIIKLEMSIVSEKELVAKFLRTNDSEWINEYISTRYKDGISSLKNYESGRGSNWSEPACN